MSEVVTVLVSKTGEIKENCRLMPSIIYIVCVRFKILMAVIVNVAVFLNIMPCYLVVYQHVVRSDSLLP
jgi:hypothetical protein